MAAIASTTSPMRFDPTLGITNAELAAVGVRRPVVSVDL